MAGFGGEILGGFLTESWSESFVPRVPRILEPSASIEILGFRFFDLSGAVTYADAFLTIAVVCLVSFGCFLIARFNAPKKDK